MIRTPSMKNASLAGIPGSGVVTLLRDAQDDVVEAHGTFRPENQGLNLDPLFQALETGRRVVFDGVVSDGQGQGDRDERSSLKVELIRIDDYTDLEGERRILVSFLAPRPGHSQEELREPWIEPSRVPVPPASGPSQARRRL